MSGYASPLYILLLWACFLVLCLVILYWTSDWNVYRMFFMGPIPTAQTTLPDVGRSVTQPPVAVPPRTESITIQCGVFVKEEAGEQEVCSICLQEYNNGEVRGYVGDCGHKFHVGCLAQWLQAHDTCPLCRNIFTV